MEHPLPASHQGQCHQKDRGHHWGEGGRGGYSFLFSSSSEFIIFEEVSHSESLFAERAFPLYFSPVLSNPQVLRHLGNFLCFQRNPIRILLTGKSNKNSIYTRASKIWSNELKTCQFQKSSLWQRAPVSQKSQRGNEHFNNGWYRNFALILPNFTSLDYQVGLTN